MSQRKESSALFIVSYLSKAEALVRDVYSMKSSIESYNIFGQAHRDYLLYATFTDVEIQVLRNFLHVF